MLYTSSMVILGDQNIKKIAWETLMFEAVWAENLHKQVVYQSLGSPPPPRPPTRAQYPNSVKNTWIRPKTCFTYLGWSVQVITVSKKISFENFHF